MTNLLNNNLMQLYSPKNLPQNASSPQNLLLSMPYSKPGNALTRLLQTEPTYLHNNYPNRYVPQPQNHSQYVQSPAVPSPIQWPAPDGADGNENSESGTGEFGEMSLPDQVDALGQISDVTNVSRGMGLLGLPAVVSALPGLVGLLADQTVQQGLQEVGLDYGGSVGGDTSISGADVAAGMENASMGMAPGEAAAASLGLGVQGMAGAGIATGPSARGQGPTGSIGATNPTNVSQSAVDANNGAGDAGDGGTVICTELRRQGLMSDEIWEADLRFGQQVHPRVKQGYLLWAKPVVRGMRRSKLFTSCVHAVAQPWSGHMAYKMGVGRDNLIGVALMAVGLPLCGFLGSMKLKTALKAGKARSNTEIV